MPKPRKTKFETPNWFNVADYGYCRELDQQGWYRSLALRRYFREEFEEAESLPEFNREIFWKSFLDASHNPHNWSDVIPPYNVPLRDASQEQFLGPLYAKLVCLEVNLNCSDVALHEAFSSWLAEKRKEAPLPTKRRGRRGKKPNVKVTGEHFARWERYNVLAVFDLEIWCLVFEREKPTHAALSGVMKPDLPPSSDPIDWGRAARAALSEALSCVELLTPNGRTDMGRIRH